VTGSAVKNDENEQHDETGNAEQQANAMGNRVGEFFQSETLANQADFLYMNIVSCCVG